MHVSFNPNITNFKQNTTPIQTEQLPLNPVTESIYQTEVPKKKPSKFINGISKIAKFFVSLGEMTKAIFKGAFYGATTAFASLLGIWTFGVLPKTLKKGSELTLKESLKHPLKHMSKSGKAFTAVAALGVASYHIIKGILNKNQRTANVDHQLKTGHRA